MIGTIKDVGIDCLTATVSKTRMLVATRCAGLISEKKALRLAKNTGFTKLSIAAPGICTSDFCVESANRLFVNGANKEEIGAIIFVSQTPDYLAPATSYVIQERLRLSHDVICFDINLGCSGFVYGIYVAASILSSMRKKVLLLAGDVTRDCKPDDISGLAVTGDAGAAAIISRRDANSGYKITYNFTSYGDKYRFLLRPRGGARLPRITDDNGRLVLIDGNFPLMDGAEVMNFSAYETYENVLTLLNYLKISANDLDNAFLHQANLAIVDALRERLELSESKAPFASGETGNTSSASIPVCMAELKRQGGYTPPKKVLLSGFGIGMSVATIVMNLSDTKVLETGAL